MNQSLQTLIVGLKARRSGNQWVAKCPAHDDRKPSLTLGIGNKQEVVVCCHAGCDQKAVVEVLKDLGLWESSSEGYEDPGPPIATYSYTDELGIELYQILRFADKKFSQQYKDDYGGWIKRKYPQQVLYHLPEVLEAAIVFVVEGEKDVETLRSHGFTATTNAGGANAKWLPQYTEALKGKSIYLLPDSDEPGRKRVNQIARELLGKVKTLYILELGDSKDITAWFEEGHSETEFIELTDPEKVSA